MIGGQGGIARGSRRFLRLLMECFLRRKCFKKNYPRAEKERRKDSEKRRKKALPRMVMAEQFGDGYG